eukprot:TRINITY_DN816_c0_g1_i4.p1 TRINITY_DN816_c0_g1~~TRINITY_DN816_c0_g1_i4.p1  ORF type:complete len:1626 (-),score=295.71 TRINITY_DN816_c0_g1_i4:39-4916(-)
MFPCWRRLLLLLLWLDQREIFAWAKPLCRDVYTLEGAEWRNCVVEIGGLAIQGADAFYNKEGKTFETYLTQVLNTSYGLEFKAIALNFNQNFEYVSDSRLDFIYSNPAAYTCMMVEFELATVASLLNFRKGNALNKFAGVIFARANATQFSNTEDLRNATIAAVSISGLGAMQLQQADLLRRNLDIMTDVKRLVFTGNQNKIVEDVESGYADVGFVRTDMIDRSVAAGTTKWEYFKVINEVADASFPFKRSTDFTPEWPIGALKHVSDEVKELVSRALMDLDRFSTDPVLSEPGIAASFSTWVPPMSYLGLLGMLEEIKYYDPASRKCLRASNVYDAIQCPSGYVKQSEENTFCQNDCKTGYTCVCSPCSKLRDPEFIFSASPVATQWEPIVNASHLDSLSNYRRECKRMELCLSAATGQNVMWSVLDQIGMDSRIKINADIIDNIEIRLGIKAPFQKMIPQNITIDGLVLQTYSLNSTVDELGSSIVQLRINGVQAGMSPVVASYFEPPQKQLNCPLGQALQASTGACEQCPAGKMGAGGNATCLPCNAGSNQSLPGQDWCAACPVGSIAGSPGQATCDACPAGRSTRGKIGQKQCDLCQPGEEAPQTNSDRCTPCSRGSFSELEGTVSCNSCPGGQTTREVGSSNATMCVCDVQEFWPLGSSPTCSPCPKHVVCSMGTTAADLGLTHDDRAAPGGQVVQLLRGYFSTAAEPTSVYLCLEDENCPGGPLLAGSKNCRNGRHGFLCESCEDGYVPRKDGCHKCEASDTILVIILILLALATIPCFLSVARKLPVQENPNATLALSFGGLALFFLQVLTSLFALQVPWQSPFAELLRSLAIISVDLDFVNFSCAGKIAPDAVFSLKMSAPMIAIVLLLGLITTLNRFRLARKRIPLLVFGNAVGQIFIASFISLALAVLVPFNCYEHPNSSRSMVTIPEILCFESPGHTGMVVASVCGFLVYIMGTTSIVIYACLLYKNAILSDNVGFVHLFRFLFMRFKPSCYWFSGFVILRNLTIAVCPMLIPPEHAGIAILLMNAVLTTSLVLCAWWTPYRSTLANVVNVTLQASLLSITFIGSLAVNGESTRSGTAWVASAITLLCTAGALVPLVWNIRRAILPAARYAMFLSHHKSGGACAARFLKMYLKKYVAGRIFYDCDDLKSLSTIFDAVKQSRSLIIILSGETLCRPWCVGEVVTAHLCNIPMQTVTIGISDESTTIKDKWQNLDAAGMKALFGKFDVLVPHGISYDSIVPSIQHALETPTIHLNLRSAESEELDKKLASLALRTPVNADSEVMMTVRRTPVNADSEVMMTVRRTMSQSPTLADMLLLSDSSDVEAVAGARVLKIAIQRKTQQQVALDFQLDFHDFKKLLQSDRCKHVLLLLTAGSVQGYSQLGRLAALARIRPGFLPCPVVIGDAYAFPDERVFAALAEGTGFEDATTSAELNLGIKGIDAAHALQAALQSIACYVNVPYANEQGLLVAVDNVLAALPSNDWPNTKVDRTQHSQTSRSYMQIDKTASETKEEQATQRLVEDANPIQDSNYSRAFMQIATSEEEQAAERQNEDADPVEEQAAERQNEDADPVEEQAAERQNEDADSVEDDEGPTWEVSFETTEAEEGTLRLKSMWA